jgi:hypothetical protein
MPRGGTHPGGYFRRGQSLTGQFAQFSSSSFSIPKGIVSPHRQAQPDSFLASRRLSQKGQQSMDLPS